MFNELKEEVKLFKEQISSEHLLWSFFVNILNGLLFPQ